MDSDYTIDHAGIDGRWRVFFIAANGLGVERYFDSRFQAAEWVEFMESLESDVDPEEVAAYLAAKQVHAR